MVGGDNGQGGGNDGGGGSSSAAPSQGRIVTLQSFLRGCCVPCRTVRTPQIEAKKLEELNHRVVFLVDMWRQYSEVRSTA